MPANNYSYSSNEWAPVLNQGFKTTGDRIEFETGLEVIPREMGLKTLSRILSKMDGTASLAELATGLDLEQGTAVAQFVQELDEHGLIDEHRSPACRPGSEAILELEEQMEALCDQTIYRNAFWTTCLSAKTTDELPQKLATGMVIENWHFLFRESYFDAPVLSYVPNTEVRLLLNQFFSEEYGHDEILLKSLEYVGLSRADMADSIPLPQTMALCNALAYWAHNDPLFFFVTLGLLEGQGMKEDSFIEACTRVGLPEPFIAPLRTHANINIGAGHGNLTRLIFQKIENISEIDFKRLSKNLPIFVNLYDDFYMAIWKYYGVGEGQIRLVSEL